MTSPNHVIRWFDDHVTSSLVDCPNHKLTSCHIWWLYVLRKYRHYVFLICHVISCDQSMFDFMWVPFTVSYVFVLYQFLLKIDNRPTLTFADVCWPVTCASNQPFPKLWIFWGNTKEFLRKIPTVEFNISKIWCQVFSRVIWQFIDQLS